MKECLKKIDLHTHTIYSDGDLDVLGNVEKAIEVGLDAIAITDHDSIESWKDIDENQYDIPVFKGVEISTYHKGDVVHILGYYLNDGGDYSELDNFLFKTRKLRLERLTKMTELLEKEGISLTIEEILKEADGAVARPHVAKAIMKKYPERHFTFDEVFDRYIGNDAPCFVPVSKYEAVDAIELLKRNHCLVVLAHPLYITKFEYQELADLGLDGIEGFYHYEFETDNSVLDFASDKNLLVTGGSDFHGPVTRNSIGNAYLEEPYISEFLEKVCMTFVKNVRK